MSYSQPKPDKAMKVMSKNASNKLMSKNVLKRKIFSSKKKTEGIDVTKYDESQPTYNATNGVIEENISEANMLNSQDDFFNESIKVGDRFLH